jgi:hypothetical protein
MAEQIKITEEELSQVLDLRVRIRENVERIGRLNVQKHFVELELSHINEELNQTYIVTEDLSAEENRIVKEISEKYGDGSLDFETGVFTPKEK